MTVPADKPKKIGPKKIAIVVHQEHSRPGRVGVLLEKRGYELHRLCPNLGCNLPEDMSDYAGVVIFGGPMSANDCGTLAGIKCELEWIPKVVEAFDQALGSVIKRLVSWTLRTPPARPPIGGHEPKQEDDRLAGEDLPERSAGAVGDHPTGPDR